MRSNVRSCPAQHLRGCVPVLRSLLSCLPCCSRTWRTDQPQTRPVPRYSLASIAIRLAPCHRLCRSYAVAGQFASICQAVLSGFAAAYCMDIERNPREYRHGSASLVRALGGGPVHKPQPTATTLVTPPLSGASQTSGQLTLRGVAPSTTSAPDGACACRSGSVEGGLNDSSAAPEDNEAAADDAAIYGSSSAYL